MREQPTVQRLSTGYWHVRWSDEIWAQFPHAGLCRQEHFFNPEYAYSVERELQANALTTASRLDGQG